MSVPCLLTLSFWPHTCCQPSSPLSCLSEPVTLHLDCLFLFRQRVITSHLDSFGSESHGLWRTRNIRSSSIIRPQPAPPWHGSGYSTSVCHRNTLGSAVGNKDLKISGLYKIEIYFSSTVCLCPDLWNL